MDRETIITELESIQKSFDEGYGIALTHKSELVRGVLELLKEQERNPVVVCPHCGKRVK